MGKEYVVQNKVKKSSELTYDDLVVLSDEFYDKNKNITRRDFKSNNNLPSIDTVLRILRNEGVSYNDFVNRYENKRNRRKIYDPKLFDSYVNKYKQLSIDSGKSLSTKVFYKNDLPSPQWFIKNCPDESVNNWSDFVRWCGFIPYYNRNEMRNKKDYVINQLYELENKLDRPIQLRDITHNSVGFSWQVIYDLWDNFEQCKMETGLLDTMGNVPKSWDYYDKMMTIALNNIYMITGSKEFTWQDFLKYKNICISKDGFKDACLRYGIDLYNYFNDKGFELKNKSGSGYITRFSDGEVCKSSYERIFSTFLRDNNIGYRRNVKYKSLATNLVCTEIDCDYVLNNNIWIEICGMIRATSEDWRNKNFDNKVFCNYQKKMLDKEQILKVANVPYIFLFQGDFDNNAFKDKLLHMMDQN